MLFLVAYILDAINMSVFYQGKEITKSWYRRLRKRRPTAALSSSEDDDVDLYSSSSLVSHRSNDMAGNLSNEISVIRDSSSSETENIVTPPNEYTLDGSSQTENTTALLHEDPPVMVFAKLRTNITSWAFSRNIPMIAVTDLLHILKAEPTIDTTVLPLDARTLFRTPISIAVEPMDGGYFCYFGFQKYFRLKSNIDYILKHLPNKKLEMSINADGMRVYKSSQDTAWPILCRVLNVPVVKIFLIAIYLGPSKPTSCEKYLESFITECNKMITEGVRIGTENYSFEILYGIFDAPAKSLVLNIKGCNGFGSCLRCDVEGYHKKKRTTFHVPEDELDDLEQRNDNSFRRREYTTLQKGPSPFSWLHLFKPVTAVVYDYMHLVLLGIMRDLITKYWMSVTDRKKFQKKNGKSMRRRRSYRSLKKPYRLTYINILRIENNMKRIRSVCPNEFARKCREFTLAHLWKATELRTFLLCLGPIVLKGRLKNRVYQHFMLLHFAICYLCDPSPRTDHLGKIQKYLKKFVLEHARIYGEHTIVHNVHALLHIIDDVRRYGNLDIFSAFAFKNVLSQLRKLIRSGAKAIQQLIKRVEEGITLENILDTNKKIFEETSCYYLHKGHSEGPLAEDVCRTDCTQYRIMKTKNFILKTQNEGDNVVMLKNRSFFRVRNIIKNRDTGMVSLIGNKFLNISDTYNFPACSSYVGIFMSTQLDTNLQVIPSEELDCKCFCFSLGAAETYILKILHTRFSTNIIS